METPSGLRARYMGDTFQGCRAGGITHDSRGVCGRALKPRKDAGRSSGESLCCQPDSGKPTVRDERGACGNVSYGGIRNPRCESKEHRSETLRLRLRASYFYPTVKGKGECWLPNGSALTGVE